MTDDISIPVQPNFAATAHVDRSRYDTIMVQSLADPEAFWAKQAERFEWIAPWTTVKNTSFKDYVAIRWFEGAKLNIADNCLRRHSVERGSKPAILWEPDDPNEAARIITYAGLSDEVSKLANVLRAQGVVKGDRVTIYMPMVPEAAMAMLACARIGAVHAVVFGGFSPDALRSRMEDSGSRFVITADEGLRGGKTIPLKVNVDQALESVPSVTCVLVYRRTGANIAWQDGRDLWWHREIEHASAVCASEPMDADDPLFILYTSGSTGKPKGIVHSTAGYMVYAAVTHETIFDCKEDDIYWCTADIGWVTGHSYVVYGPLANGATTVMFEGVPNYPDPSRFWKIIDKHKVTLFYTAPTAIRALMREGDAWVRASSRASLRLLASVGEPINPEAWLWYYHVVGQARCPVIDTWWQTETGGIMIAPLPGATDLKPGSAALPFFGVKPELYTPEGERIEGEGEGLLCIADSWPGQARTMHGDHQRFIDTYFSTVPGTYFTGDGCRRDADGYYWITGRVDDVLNVAGHRLGTAEIESVLAAHPAVAEAAVVGYPHAIKGQGIYVYAVLNNGVVSNDVLTKELIAAVRKGVGPIATPDLIHYTSGLPKTRSGKIMRRLLRKIAENDCGNLGDVSTLLDPGVVDELIGNRLNH